MVTDYANFAYLCDVFILPSYRNIGLSKWLPQTIVQHDVLKDMRRLMLTAADAQGLYQQFGFTTLSKPECWMKIYKPLPAS